MNTYILLNNQQVILTGPPGSKLPPVPAIIWARPHPFGSGGVLFQQAQCSWPLPVPEVTYFHRLITRLAVRLMGSVRIITSCGGSTATGMTGS